MKDCGVNVREPELKSLGRAWGDFSESHQLAYCSELRDAAFTRSSMPRPVVVLVSLHLGIGIAKSIAGKAQQHVDKLQRLAKVRAAKVLHKVRKTLRKKLSVLKSILTRLTRRSSPQCSWRWPRQPADAPQQRKGSRDCQGSTQRRRPHDQVCPQRPRDAPQGH